MSGQQTLSNLENRGTFRTALNTMFTELYGAGVPFRYTVKLSAATAGTLVHVVPVALVGPAQKVFVLGATLNVNGATAWTDSTATKATLQGTDAVAGITYPKSVLTGNALLVIGSTGGITVANAILQGIGFNAGTGLDFVADGNFAAGSDIYLTVWGAVQ